MKDVSLYISSVSEIERLVASRAWVDISNAIHNLIDFTRTDLETCPVEELTRLQGKILAYRTILDLPSIIMEDLNDLAIARENAIIEEEDEDYGDI